MKLYRVEDGAADYWMTLALGDAEEARNLMCATVGESRWDYDWRSWRVREMSERGGRETTLGRSHTTAWDLHAAATEPTCHACTEWDGDDA